MIQDFKRGRLQYKIALFCIFLTVLFLVIVLNFDIVISGLGVMYTENTIGDADYVIYPKIPKIMDTKNEITEIFSKFNSISDLNDVIRDKNLSNALRNTLSKYRFLDTKYFQDKISNNSGVTGVTPRWVSPAMVYNSKKPSLYTSAFLLLGDTEREIKLGIGRKLDILPLSDGECYFLTPVLDMIEWTPGDEVIVELDI